MKLVIGIVGEKGSGKETFVSSIKNNVLSKSVFHTRSSDVLAETLTLWDLPLTRHNLQHLAIVMDSGFGSGTLTHAVNQRIVSSTEDVVIFDGIRWFTDAEMIRSFPENVLVYVTADVATRYERTKLRKTKVGEAFASFETFLEEEQVATELDIPKIGANADVIIKNNGTVLDFENQVKDFCKKYIK